MDDRQPALGLLEVFHEGNRSIQIALHFCGQLFAAAGKEKRCAHENICYARFHKCYWNIAGASVASFGLKHESPSFQNLFGCLNHALQGKLWIVAQTTGSADTPYYRRRRREETL